MKKTLLALALPMVYGLNFLNAQDINQGSFDIDRKNFKTELEVKDFDLNNDEKTDLVESRLHYGGSVYVTLNQFDTDKDGILDSFEYNNKFKQFVYSEKSGSWKLRPSIRGSIESTSINFSKDKDTINSYVTRLSIDGNDVPNKHILHKPFHKDEVSRRIGQYTEEFINDVSASYNARGKEGLKDLLLDTFYKTGFFKTSSGTDLMSYAYDKSLVNYFGSE